MPSFEDLIKSEQAERLKNIALSFKESDEEIIKGLSEDEFNTKYPKEGFEIYSEQSMKNFEKALKDEINKNPESKQELIEKAQKDLSKLQKKTVIGKDGKKHTVWVKQKEESKNENFKVSELGIHGKYADGTINGKKIKVDLSGDFLRTIDTFDKKENRDKVKDLLIEKYKKDIDDSFPFKVGETVKIPNNLTSDPLNKQGESGKVISVRKDEVSVEFNDYRIGRYQVDALEKIK